jgi:hypothetical protein
VVQKLSGAHLLIKLEQSLAVRAYFSCDLKDRMEEESSTDSKTDDFDDLHSFLKTFKLAVIFFILPIEEQRQQLDDPQSFYHRAQRLVRNVTHSDNKIVRIFLLSTPEKAVAILSSFTNACNDQSVAKKRLYFEKQHQRYFLPRPNHIPTTSIPAGASHIGAAVSDWANRFEFPPGEENVIASMLGTLQVIGTADDRVLQAIPLDSRSKECMILFFGSMGEEDLMERNNSSSGGYHDTSPLSNMMSEVPNSRRAASSQVSPTTPGNFTWDYNDSQQMPRIPSEIQHVHQPPAMQKIQYHPYHMTPSKPIQEPRGSYYNSFTSRGQPHYQHERNQFPGNQQSHRLGSEPGSRQGYAVASNSSSRGPTQHHPGRGHPPPIRRNARAPFPPKQRLFAHRLND